MKKKEKNVIELREELFTRYEMLRPCAEALDAAFTELSACFHRGGKLLVAGNGGSAADSEHIAGELMKSFLFLRRPETETVQQLSTLYGVQGAELAHIMEGAFPVVPLTSLPAVSTAFANDAEPDACFAQMVYGLGRKEDVFLGITTSGNSRNIQLSLMVAKAKGIKSILLTGGDGGVCKKEADIVICVGEKETFKIQELHLPIYHALCAMLEAELFEEKKCTYEKRSEMRQCPSCTCRSIPN